MTTYTVGQTLSEDVVVPRPTYIRRGSKRINGKLTTIETLVKNTGVLISGSRKTADEFAHLYGARGTLTVTHEGKHYTMKYQLSNGGGAVRFEFV